jgi:light-regulated signal transduction histidine kinase (bacteriophytochrome)
MRAVLGNRQSLLEDGRPVDAQTYASAILNILEDAAEEKVQLTSTQRAVVNILDDFAGERALFEATQKAILNILDDSADEKTALAGTQRAVLNILEDMDIEKKNVEQANGDLRHEVAERVRTEEALRIAKASAEGANLELEAFSYSVAHDLRAPLRSIDGFSQALLEDCADQLDAEGTRYLKHVREAAQQMGELIDGLLNLSRVTRAELRHELVDMSELARAVMQRLRESQPDREADFAVEDGLIAQGDPRLLDVVLTNLLSNAWKFTRNRSSARIEFTVKTDANPTIYLVRDNGAGFDAKYVDKLFGVFQRLHTTHEFEGTGIGLATVRRIIVRHGGRIWAEGEVDKGATFYFTLQGERV